jgi:hypothetical protein
MLPTYSDRRRRGGRMRGGVKRSSAGRSIGGVNKNGSKRKKGAENLRCTAARRSIDVVKSGGWRMIGGEPKLSASRRKLPGKGRWRSDNVKKIKLWRLVAEIVGHIVRRWQ